MIMKDDIFYKIEDYVIKNGKEGFTNNKIKNDLGYLVGFEKEWIKFKNNARRNGKNGLETMFFENGKYYF